MRAGGLLLGLAAAAAAQDLTRKAPPQAGPIALVGGTVHPVSGPPIEGGFVFFAEGRVVAVGRGDAPPGAEAVDVRGRHVYPGLLDAHTSLGLVEIGAVRATRDFDEVGEITPEVRACVAVNPDSWLIPVARSNGVLAFGTFPQGGAIPGRASVMRADGWTWEDMTVAADAGLVVGWPMPRPRYVPYGEVRPDELAREVRAAMQRVREAFADARAYLDAKAADPSLPVDLRWEAMRPALAGERPVFFEAQDLDEITTAVEFASARGLRAVLLGGHDAALCTDLLKEHDVAVLVANLHRFPKRTDSDFDEAYALPAKLEAAGVRWCLASGERTANVRNLPYAAARAAAYGLPKEAALKGITLYAAQVLGVADRLGSLEPGKSATLIVTDGDPLEVATHVEMAYIDGRRIDLSNKQTELHEKYKEKYRQLGLLPR